MQGRVLAYDEERSLLSVVRESDVCIVGMTAKPGECGKQAVQDRSSGTKGEYMGRNVWEESVIIYIYRLKTCLTTDGDGSCVKIQVSID